MCVFSSIHETQLVLAPPIKTPTSYGGRLTWTLPGGNLLYLHIKDKNKIRTKKRWSQVRLWSNRKTIATALNTAGDVHVLSPRLPSPWQQWWLHLLQPIGCRKIWEIFNSKLPSREHHSKIQNIPEHEPLTEGAGRQLMLVAACYKPWAAE